MGKLYLEEEQLNNKSYDIIIVGGGHAGIEASLASARSGNKALMICGNFRRVGNMPCNPSIGGPAKGIIVREIDALGGEMAKAADKTAIQFKLLNSSKGPAVRALRVQSDKLEYPKYMQKVCLDTENLDILQSLVDQLIIENNQVKGIVTENGTTVYSKAVIITTGTYLSSRILCGKQFTPSGPDGEQTNYGLSKSLKDAGLTLKRLKTGTPARIYTNSIDFSKAKLEPGTNMKIAFSYDDNPEDLMPYEEQDPCYLIYTTDETKKIILDHLKESSMYSGIVEGVGPRYCPSIEDKIVRFSDKEKHQIFLEPESRSIPETYIQGFSTSMPHYVQDMMLHSLPGFENCKVARYAYAIEYDAIDPLELKPSLESKIISNLFFGGQVNGTSGYEEAAGQGLIAGINANYKINNHEPLILRRDEAYIGVLIDDLVTKGITDPYRMLTSRAEFRLLLRHDNADTRLTKYGYEAKLINEERYNRFINKQNLIAQEVEKLHELKVTPKGKTNEYLESIGSQALLDGISAANLMKRPEVSYNDICNLLDIENTLPTDVSEQIDIEIKYKGYIDKAYKEAEHVLKLESRKIPEDINYYDIPNLASEAKEKLTKVKPLTVAQANRISGVNPADISILLIYLETLKK